MEVDNTVMKANENTATATTVNRAERIIGRTCTSKTGILPDPVRATKT